MMFSTFAFILLLNAVLALPSPRPESSVSVSNIGRINTTSEMHEAIKADGPRVRDLFQRAQPRAKAHGNLKARQTLSDGAVSIPITCNILRCIAEVSIGTPPTLYNLSVDTGSSNTWVGADKPFVSTSSIVSTGQTVSIQYGTGNMSGIEVLDTVSLGPGLTIQAQSIGVANQSVGFGDGVDGILGIGPTNLTQGKLSSSPGTIVPTVVDSLQNQGSIRLRTLGILTQPIGPSGSAPGEITFGGTDSSNLTSEIAFFPNTESTLGGASQFWALDVGITYGGTTDILSDGPAIVDIGSSDLLLNGESFLAYQKATGGVLDEGSGFLTITPEQFENLQPLNFTIFQNSYSFSPNAQIAPRAPGSDPSKIFLFVSSLGSSNQTVGAILGASFLRYFYTILDSDYDLVGMATTQFTTAIVN